MEKRFEKYKGIHPGLVLERELKKRSLKKSPFAISIGEHPQTLHAIMKGRRGMPVGLAMKIEKALGIEEGTLALLQTYHDIKQEREKQVLEKPDLSWIRPQLFWDTDIHKIDWQRQQRAVIQRVFERGNDQERDAITAFYGRAKVRAALQAKKTTEIALKIFNN